MSKPTEIELPEGVTLRDVQAHADGAMGWLYDHDPDRARKLVDEARASGADEVRLLFVPAGGFRREDFGSLDLGNPPGRTRAEGGMCADPGPIDLVDLTPEEQAQRDQDRTASQQQAQEAMTAMAARDEALRASLVGRTVTAAFLELDDDDPVALVLTLDDGRVVSVVGFGDGDSGGIVLSEAHAPT